MGISGRWATDRNRGIAPRQSIVAAVQLKKIYCKAAAYR